MFCLQLSIRCGKFVWNNRGFLFLISLIALSRAIESSFPAYEQVLGAHYELLQSYGDQELSLCLRMDKGKVCCLCFVCSCPSAVESF